ncbi:MULTISPECIES: phosphoethanolamine transferase [unclassified Acinetobacter]|uniref:phosphoethanolamine transferase n=1 Tax=unclassified Acinetobacter TaxID=196816 RepID=UPI0035B846E5
MTSLSDRLFAFRHKPINAYVMMAIVAAFLLVTANLSFFKQLLKVYPFTEHLAFFISSIFVLGGVLLLLIVLLSYRFTLKAVLVLLILIAAATSYFTDTYGTVYDTTMLQNALQTDTAESKDLMNAVFLLRLFFLGLVPSIWVISQKVVFPPLKKSLLQRMLTWLVSLLIVGVPIGLLSKQYASFFREHKPIRFYTNPITPVYAMGKLASIEYKKATAPKEMIAHASDAAQTTLPSNRKPKLMVMVVGETARADHSSLNGYPRETMPQLAKLQGAGLTNFSQVMSCGTSTAYSVPCMFSYLGEKDYDVDTAQYQENVIDTLHRLGVNVLWRDNNSDSKGVMNRLPAEQYDDYKVAPTNTVCNTNPYNECRDVGMLVGLDDYVKNHQGKDVLIVLHQMGNHGPAYYKRYDAEFAKFTTVCESNELAKCDHQALINAFDNAFLATDDFLAKTVGWLKQYDDSHQVAMLYASDHGESLGEKGIYLHGMPKAIAPIEQRHISAVMWVGKNSGIQTVDGNKPLTHDAITPTLLSLFDVHSTAIEGKAKFIQ